MKQVNNWLNIIQNYLLPPTCILCGGMGFNDQDICPGCYWDLPYNRHACCRCGEAFDFAVSADTLCGACIKKTPSFDSVQAPFLYQDEIQFLITRLKYGTDHKNARLLGYLLAEALNPLVSRPECIIPVPLHKNRYRTRGFNQAQEIANVVSNLLAIRVDSQLCIRQQDTPHQTGLSAQKRRQNLRRAFAVVMPVAYRHIAIMDDVMTTGSTVSALALTLKRAGVTRVDVWVCARA
jgi:ComF family protein